VINLGQLGSPENLMTVDLLYGWIFAIEIRLLARLLAFSTRNGFFVHCLLRSWLRPWTRTHLMGFQTPFLRILHQGSKIEGKTPRLQELVLTHPLRSLEGRPKSNSKLKGTSSLLATIMRYAGENIPKRMYLIHETCELTTNIVCLGSRMTNFRKYLQVDLENDEEFYKGVISTFAAKVSSLSEF
jgi:hypothetical protein